jgi:hypothetical protein
MERGTRVWQQEYLSIILPNCWSQCCRKVLQFCKPMAAPARAVNAATNGGELLPITTAVFSTIQMSRGLQRCCTAHMPPGRAMYCAQPIAKASTEEARIAIVALPTGSFIGEITVGVDAAFAVSTVVVLSLVDTRADPNIHSLASSHTALRWLHMVLIFVFMTASVESLAPPAFPATFQIAET